MKLAPVKQAVSPRYPHRRSARWALGLLALGGSTLVGADLVGCGNMTPPTAHAAGTTCAGDMPAAAPEAEPEAAPAGIPELEQIHVRGDMVAPDPHIAPEVEPGPIDGDVLAVDGDMVMPDPEPEPTPQPGAQAEPVTTPPSPHDLRVAGGMPAPVEPDPIEPLLIPGEMPAPEFDPEAISPDPAAVPEVDDEG